jgi:type I restriction enzyme M protein
MNEFESVINKIANRYDVNTVFDDFLTMSICALSFGKMEERYNKISIKYREEEIKLFSHALVALINEAEKNSNDGGKWCDVLGSFFENNLSSSQASHLGQFFTSPEICDLMAKIAQNPELKEGKILDPACGSGRGLLAHSRLNPQNRFNFYYYACDISETCVKMTVLNYVMFGLKGYIIHMDSLRGKIWGGYRVYLPETGLCLTPLDAETCNTLLTESTPTIQPETPKTQPEIQNLRLPNFNQLQLF